jgi:hypothetical protein
MAAPARGGECVRGARLRRLAERGSLWERTCDGSPRAGRHLAEFSRRAGRWGLLREGVGAADGPRGASRAEPRGARRRRRRVRRI